jgi:hypothetical protein
MAAGVQGETWTPAVSAPDAASAALAGPIILDAEQAERL